MIFIYDRTQADVDLLKSLNSKINNIGWSGLTSKEKSEWLLGPGEDLYDTNDLLLTTSTGAELTASGLSVRGAIHHTDLNRIESNCSTLQQLLEQYGYISIVDIKTDWVVEDFLWLEDINRIKQNVIDLADCYYTLVDSPTILLTPVKLDYIQVNDIEKMLFDLDTLLTRMINSFIYCGTFVCGQSIVL